jgi:hypothetical protein
MLKAVRVFFNLRFERYGRFLASARESSRAFSPSRALHPLLLTPITVTLTVCVVSICVVSIFVLFKERGVLPVVVVFRQPDGRTGNEKERMM